MSRARDSQSACRPFPFSSTAIAAAMHVQQWLLVTRHRSIRLQQHARCRWRGRAQRRLRRPLCLGQLSCQWRGCDGRRRRDVPHASQSAPSPCVPFSYPPSRVQSKASGGRFVEVSLWFGFFFFVLAPLFSFPLVLRSSTRPFAFITTACTLVVGFDGRLRLPPHRHCHAAPQRHESFQPSHPTHRTDTFKSNPLRCDRPAAAVAVMLPMWRNAATRGSRTIKVCLHSHSHAACCPLARTAIERMQHIGFGFGFRSSPTSLASRHRCCSVLTQQSTRSS